MIALADVLMIMLVGCGKTEVRGPEPVINESKLPSILFIQRTSLYLGEHVSDGIVQTVLPSSLLIRKNQKKSKHHAADAEYIWSESI